MTAPVAPDPGDPDPASAHAWARAYAGHGLRVVPIAPGQKRPTLPAWQDAATTDLDTIDAWWTGLHRDHGVGLALGAGMPYADSWLFAIDIDQHGVNGEDTLHDLEQRHGALPETWEAITGGGGRHLLYWAEREVRNGKLGPGVDLRGAGGQIVAEPTVHPSGQRYAWVDGAAPWERQCAEAPAWVLDLIEAPPETSTKPPRAPQTGVYAEVASPRPGDLWAAQTTWETLLTGDGWTRARDGNDGEERWVRPGKGVRDGISATVGYMGSDVLKVFTSSVPQLDVDATYTKFGYIAATRHHGDHSAAAKAMHAAGWRSTPSKDWDHAGAEEKVSDDGDAEGWPIAPPDDISAILSGDYEPIVPTLMVRTDGAGMIYPGRVNSLAGEPGGGKTWVALAACAQELAAGNTVALIDYEDRLDTAVRRLDSLGVDHDAIRERFRYVTPTVAYKGGRLPANVVALAGVVTLVVVDSMGEALAHSELSQNDDGEVRAWMDACARRLADGGAAVLVLDHVTKDSEHRGRWAIGSQRKLAAIDGVAYMMETTQAATKVQVGRARIKCSKDRLGNYQHGHTIADVTITPDGDRVVIEVAAHVEATTESGEMLLTGYMERISKYLEMTHDGAVTRDILANVDGADKHVKTALRQLVDLGYLSTESGVRGAVIHRVEDPYREDETATAAPRRHRGGTAAGRGQNDRGTAAGVYDPPRSPRSITDLDTDTSAATESVPESKATTSTLADAAHRALWGDPDTDQEPTL